MAQIYASALSKPQEVTEEVIDWEKSIRNAGSSSCADQKNSFLERFVLQLQKQGQDAKEMVKKVQAIEEMFSEKMKGVENKLGLKFGGVEFSDLYEEFFGENLTFVQKKKLFSTFDLDMNGHISLTEFLLYCYKIEILAGYKARNDVEIIENEIVALMKEYSCPAVFIDSKLDEAVLGLKKLAEEYEASVAAAKEEGKTGVKKVQLPGNLQKLEKKYVEDQKNYLSPDAINKKKAAIKKSQKKIVKDLVGEIAAEAEEARGPQKKKA